MTQKDFPQAEDLPSMTVAEAQSRIANLLSQLNRTDKYSNDLEFIESVMARHGFTREKAEEMIEAFGG